MRDLTILNRTIALTKAGYTEAGEAFAKGLLDQGDITPLDALIKLRALKEAIDVAIKTIKDDAMDEAETYGRDDRTRFGVGFQVRGGSAKYSYEHDDAWRELKEYEKHLATQRKEREKFLRNLDKEMADTETGEIIVPAELLGFGEPSLALTFPKE